MSCGAAVLARLVYEHPQMGFRPYFYDRFNRDIVTSTSGSALRLDLAENTCYCRIDSSFWILSRHAIRQPCAGKSLPKRPSF